VNTNLYWDADGVWVVVDKGPGYMLERNILNIEFTRRSNVSVEAAVKEMGAALDRVYPVGGER